MPPKKQKIRRCSLGSFIVEVINLLQKKPHPRLGSVSAFNKVNGLSSSLFAHRCVLLQKRANHAVKGSSQLDL